MRLIGEPKSWRNVRVRRVVKSATVSVAVINEFAKIVAANSAADGIDCTEIEVGLGIVTFCGRALNLVADAEIKSKFWGRFPVVLKVNSVVILGGRREAIDPRACFAGRLRPFPEGKIRTQIQ